MQGTMTGKILAEHLVEGRLAPGEEIGIRIDQTLTQDATGTLAYLMFEAMGRIQAVRRRLSGAPTPYTSPERGSTSRTHQAA